MDLASTEKVLEMVQNREIEVITLPRSSEYSPFALPILDRITTHDVLRPIVPTKAIIDIVKERLNSGEVRLFCLFKADYDGVKQLRSLPERITCPKCGCTLLASTYINDCTLIHIAKKRILKKKLMSDEEKRWQVAWKSATLTQTYGKKALVVLGARGVGPTTAVRILHSHYRNESEFYMNIIQAERNYLRTRMFWDH